MISCDNAKNMLSDYLEQTLSPEQVSLVDEHLAHCHECKRVFDDVAFLTQKMRELPHAQTSENFDGQLRLRISRDFRSAEHPVFSKRGLTFGFSGAVLIAVITFFIISTNNPENGTLIQSSSNQVINQAGQMGPTVIGKRTLPQANPVDFSTPMDSMDNVPQKVDQSKIKLVDQESN
jgi:predicted anti-sigma-YlaC factor YlaD